MLWKIIVKVARKGLIFHSGGVGIEDQDIIQLVSIWAGDGAAIINTSLQLSRKSRFTTRIPVTWRGRAGRPRLREETTVIKLTVERADVASFNGLGIWATPMAASGHRDCIGAGCRWRHNKRALALVDTCLH